MDQNDKQLGMVGEDETLPGQSRGGTRHYSAELLTQILSQLRFSIAQSPWLSSSSFTPNLGYDERKRENWKGILFC